MRTNTKDQEESVEVERLTPLLKKGWRPGLTKGMKYKPTVKLNDARSMLNDAIIRELPDILKGQIELAKGIHMARHVVVDELTGEVVEAEVFREKPDTPAAKFLIDQLIGKAKEKVEINATLRTLVDVVNDLELQGDLEQLSLAERNKR